MRIGNVEVHGSSSHHVTDCLHRHTEKTTETGAMRMSGGTAPVSPQSQPAAGKGELSALWSPVDWLKDLLRRGRGLALRLWGNDLPGAAEGKDSGMTASKGETLSSVPGQEPLRRQSHDSINQTAAQQMPPYFILPENRRSSPGILQRILTRVHSVSGYLEKHLPFAHTGSFHTKQQNREEDLRRRSRYRKDDEEIECILTDDSYLLDSYNKKGEYSKLSTENRNAEGQSRRLSGENRLL